MKYASLSKKNVLIIAILVMFVIAIYNWFVTPQTQYLAAAQEYKDTVDSMKKTSIIMSKNQKLKRGELEGRMRQFEQQKQSLFDANEAKDFLANLQSIAEESDCMVMNIRHSPIKEVAVKDNKDNKDNDSVSIHFYQNQVDMRFLGRYENIVEFLNTIQNRTAKVWVDSINIGMKEITSSYLTCDAMLSIYTMDVKEIQNDADSKK